MLSVSVRRWNVNVKGNRLTLKRTQPSLVSWVVSPIFRSPSIHLSIYEAMSIYISINPSIYLFIYLSTFPLFSSIQNISGWIDHLWISVDHEYLDWPWITRQNKNNPIGWNTYNIKFRANLSIAYLANLSIYLNLSDLPSNSFLSGLSLRDYLSPDVLPSLCVYVSVRDPLESKAGRKQQGVHWVQALLRWPRLWGGHTPPSPFHSGVNCVPFSSFFCYP